MKIPALLLIAALCCHAMDPALKARVTAAWTPEEARALNGLLAETVQQGLPAGPLENKVREGLAKNVPAARVLQAVSARKALLMEAGRDGKSIGESALLRKVYASEKKSTLERIPNRDREHARTPAAPAVPDRDSKELKDRDHEQSVPEMDNREREQKLERKERKMENREKKLEHRKEREKKGL